MQFFEFLFGGILVTSPFWVYCICYPFIRKTKPIPQVEHATVPVIAVKEDPEKIWEDLRKKDQERKAREQEDWDREFLEAQGIVVPEIAPVIFQNPDGTCANVDHHRTEQHDKHNRLIHAHCMECGYDWWPLNDPKKPIVRPANEDEIAAKRKQKIREIFENTDRKTHDESGTA